MARVTLSGASDDLIEVEGHVSGCDEYNSEDSHFVLTGPNGALRVRVWFTKRGVWAVACAPTDEGESMLSATIVPAGNGYSAEAIVDGVSLVVHEVAQ